MPLARRVCFLPWQSRFIETQELMVTVNTAIKPNAKKILFMVRSKFNKVEQYGCSGDWVELSHQKDNGV